MALAVVSFQWFLFGFSLAFGSGGPFIGNFENAFFINLFETNGEKGDVYEFNGVSNITGSAFMVFQGIPF